MIKVYGFEGCPYCNDLRNLLKEEGIEFNYVDINLQENNEDFDNIIKISNSEEVPIILVGKQILIPNVSFKTIKEGVKIIKKFLI